MRSYYDELVVAEEDKTVALRLLSALVTGWYFVPPAAQVRLIRDACLTDGDGGIHSLPDEVLAFINQHTSVTLEPHQHTSITLKPESPELPERKAVN
jgi:hypothetical protein